MNFAIEPQSTARCAQPHRALLPINSALRLRQVDQLFCAFQQIPFDDGRDESLVARHCDGRDHVRAYSGPNGPIPRSGAGDLVHHWFSGGVLLLAPAHS